jgi:hypothetical protein
MSTIEELLGRNSSGSSLENREYDRGDPLRWPRNTLYLQKLAQTSPTIGGRSVGMVRLRAKATEFVLFVYPGRTVRNNIEVCDRITWTVNWTNVSYSSVKYLKAVLVKMFVHKDDDKIGEWRVLLYLRIWEERFFPFFRVRTERLAWIQAQNICF